MPLCPGPGAGAASLQPTVAFPVTCCHFPCHPLSGLLPPKAGPGCLALLTLQSPGRGPQPCPWREVQGDRRRGLAVHPLLPPGGSPGSLMLGVYLLCPYHSPAFCACSGAPWLVTTGLSEQAAGSLGSHIHPGTLSRGGLWGLLVSVHGPGSALSPLLGCFPQSLHYYTPLQMKSLRLGEG